jgi:hypothetical protein
VEGDIDERGPAVSDRKKKKKKKQERGRAGPAARLDGPRGLAGLHARGREGQRGVGLRAGREKGRERIGVWVFFLILFQTFKSLNSFKTFELLNSFHKFSN